VLAVLVASAVSDALTDYFYTHNSKTEEFEEHFQDSVDKVIDSYLRRNDRTVGIADSFVLGLVSNQKWPLSRYRTSIRTLAKATLVAVYPLVMLDHHNIILF
jgi:hypothetical protein